MLRALLFDFNGVLVDDEPIHHELLVRVAGEEGLDIEPAEVWELCVGRDDRTGFRGMFERAGRELPEATLSRLVARKGLYYRQRTAADGLQPPPGVLGLVDEARDRGLMLGVVTGALRSEVEEALQALGRRSAFKVVVAAEDVREGKPDPAGYRKALQALNGLPPLPERLLHPHEVVALEDSPAGVEAAARAGFWAIGLSTTHPPEALSAADRVVEACEGLTVGHLIDGLDV